jgi:hypothetical protein
LGFCCIGLLWACFFALPPFSGARSDICQLAVCCKCTTVVCWLFFNFATSFDFGCWSLALEISFVERYLPYFRQCFITRPLSPLLPFQSLFNESSHGHQLLVLPLFSGALTAPPPPLLCVPFLFLVYYSDFCLFCFVFLWGWGLVCAGG